MKRIAVLLALLFASVSVHAQTTGTDQVANYMYKYDLDSATLTFCKLIGREGDPYGGDKTGSGLVKTTGSSTSITENTVGQNPFTDVAVGDMLVFRRPTGVVDRRIVVTRTDAANIVVETAIDLSGGVAFRFRTLTCGTTATDGWVDASGSDHITVVYQIDQQNTTTGIDFRVDCRGPGPGASAVQVYPATGFVTDTTATIANQHAVAVNGRWSACRVGVKLTSTDDGGDTGANAEQITAFIVK